MGKNLSTEDPVSIFGSGRSPGEREWLPTPAFLPGKLDGQRSLLGYSPWGCKESDMSDYAHAHTHTHKKSEKQHSANRVRIFIVPGISVIYK